MSRQEYGYAKMTLDLESAIPRRMGRKKRWHQAMIAKFQEGTFERIAAVLGEKEDRTDFVRLAVEREVERRERTSAKPKKPRRR
jgi:hypothetical protein